MKNNEHDKLDHIMTNMDTSQMGGQWTPETKQQMHNFLDAEKERIANEDPEALILCNCHGEYWPSKCVDIWGICHPELLNS